MIHEAAFHEGYCKAMEEAVRLVDSLGLERDENFVTLMEQLRDRIAQARCMSRSSLAAQASGKFGY